MFIFGTVRNGYGLACVICTYSGEVIDLPMADHSRSHQSIAQRTRLWLYVGVAALAIAASITGLGNGFALDDLALIADNTRVHSLDQWWRLFTVPYWPPQFGASLYRPIVTLGYSLQWAAGHGAPWVFHLTSIVLYAVVSVLVAALALELIPPAAAFAVAALFAIHPVHVEAVANVVGQSELLAAIAALGASVIYVRARRADTLRPGAIASIGGLFAIACLSKEHALLLPVLLIALDIFANERQSAPSGVRMFDRVRSMAPLVVTLAAIAFAYVAARTMVVGELLGEKHLVPIDGIRRVWVMLVVVPHWVRLLAWPAHLSADYSPQAIQIPPGPGPEIAVGLALLIASAAAFAALGMSGAVSNGDRRAARLGLAWLAITLLPVSNLFSVLLVAERTLLMPSVGAMIVVGAVTSAILRRSTARGGAFTRVTLVTIVTCLVVIGAGRSRDRHRVWKDDATLFATTAQDAPRSYRAQFFYGQMLFRQGKRAEGERRLRLAIALNPTSSDVSPLNYLATEYRDAGMCPQALPLYERALANDARRPDVRYGLAACLLATGHAGEARRLAQDGVRRGELKSLFLQLIARSDSIAARGS